MFIEKFGDLMIGVFFLIFSFVMFAMTSVLPPSLMGGLGSDFVPKIIAVGIAVLSLLQTYNGYKIMKNPMAKDAEEEFKPEYPRVLATIASFTIYVFVLKTVGFMISSAVYLTVQMTILATKEKRKILLFAIIGIIVSVVVYFIFRSGLSVMLPAGILG